MQRSLSGEKIYSAEARSVAIDRPERDVLLRRREQPQLYRQQPTKSFEPGSMNVTCALPAFRANSTAVHQASGGTDVSTWTFGSDSFIAFYVVCFGAMEALSLGSLLFPQSEEFPNEDYRRLGMSLGLLTSVAADITVARCSQMQFSVGGVLVPNVIMMKAFFQTKIGAEDAQTVIVLIPLMSLLFGVAVVIFGNLEFGRIAEHCPFSIYAGFMAACGVDLVECALGIMCQSFEKFEDTASWQALLNEDAFFQVITGTIGAFLCFSIPRLNGGRRNWFMRLIQDCCLIQDWNIVLVTCIAIECVVVYFYTLHYSGMTFHEARDKGFFFQTSSEPTVKMPTCIWAREWFWYFKKGTVKLQKIFNSDTLALICQQVLLGFLVVTKSVHGLSAMSKSVIDIDKEIVTIGYASILSGSLGGIAATTVTWCSLAAQERWAGWYFKFLIIIWSVAFYSFSEYIVAYIPKVIIGSFLMWLGLLLATPFVWDSMNCIPKREYSEIVMMALICHFFGFNAMFFVGLLSTLIQTTSTAIGECCFQTFTLGDVRSNYLRPIPDQICLRDQGNRTLVVRIESGRIPLWASRQIRKKIEMWCAETSLEMVDHVLIDMELVSDVSTSALYHFTELVAVARSHGFHVIFVLPEEIEQTMGKQICKFEAYQNAGRSWSENEVPMIREMVGGSFILTAPTCKDHVFGTAIEAFLRGDRLSEGFRASDSSYKKLDARRGNESDEFGPILARDVMTALALCENSILQAMEDTGKTGEETQLATCGSSLNELNEQVCEMSSRDSCRSLVPPMVCNVATICTKRPHEGPTSSARHSEIQCVCTSIEFVLADTGFEKRFEGDVRGAVQKLAGFLEVEDYLEDAIIYRGTDEERKHDGGWIPHIYWLVQGELVHTFGRGHVEKTRFQVRDDIYQCIGPLRTFQSFMASSVHVGQLEATRPSTVVYISHKSYVKLLERFPLAAHAFISYLRRIEDRFFLTRPTYKSAKTVT